MNSKTHSARILSLLKAGETVSQLEASRWDDPCLRLAARISDLRDGLYDGFRYDIETMTVKNADGRGQHARYRLKTVQLPPAFPEKPKVEMPANSLF